MLPLLSSYVGMSIELGGEWPLYYNTTVSMPYQQNQFQIYIANLQLLETCDHEWRNIEHQDKSIFCQLVVRS